ncbi:cysteine--tRNA ligase, partial [archaeon]|nr:cysteine--tRNA ligase [archaeon]
QALKEKTIDLKTIVELDKILGLKLHDPNAKQLEIPKEIQTLLDARQKAREEKNWVDSDRLRDEIYAAGFVVEDGADGQRIVEV